MNPPEGYLMSRTVALTFWRRTKPIPRLMVTRYSGRGIKDASVKHRVLRAVELVRVIVVQHCWCHNLQCAVQTKPLYNLCILISQFSERLTRMSMQ